MSKPTPKVKDPVRAGRRDSVDSGPFLEWLDRWSARQTEDRAGWSYDRPSASMDDLASLADVSVRTFHRARTTGRISHAVVDRVLVAAGGDTPLSLLYPELYE